MSRRSARFHSSLDGDLFLPSEGAVFGGSPEPWLTTDESIEAAVLRSRARSPAVPSPSHGVDVTSLFEGSPSKNTKETAQSFTHPILQQIFFPNPYAPIAFPSLSGASDVYSNSTKELDKMTIEAERLTLAPRRDHEELDLRSMERLLWALDELPDDVTKFVDETEIGGLEYPHCYLVMDDTRIAPFDRALRYF